MAGLKLTLFVIYLFVLDPSLAGQSCPGLCEIKYNGYCRNRGGVSITATLSGSLLPCATCNTTGQADVNQLGCIPSNLRKLQVAGHSDRNGKLKPLPSLAQLRLLLLGPGHIVTVERGAFSAFPELWGLSMGKNAIKTVESWFAGSSKLEKLVLSWNEVDEIKENAFQPLKRLYYLEMMHNRLRAVEAWHFASLTNLKILHLSYNSISHIARESFSGLSKLKALSLDNNKLSSLSTEWLQGISAGNHYNIMGGGTVTTDGNPFRCTCALGNLKSLGSRVNEWHELQCTYPPSLYGRKIARLSTEKMLCPHPTANISLQDHGTTLVCEVFWEKKPEIGWLDPGERAIGRGESLDPCGGPVTTSLEHEIPTTESPEGGTAYSTDDPGLPYIGKSTSTLRMSPQAYRCWAEGSFRCDVQSAAGNVFASVPLTKLKEKSEQDQRQEHTVMPTVYTTTPAQRNARMTERIVKTTDKNTPRESTTQAEHTVMAAVYTMTNTQRNARMMEGIVKTTDKNTPREGTASTAEKSTRQSGRMTERNTKTTDRKSNQDDTVSADDDAQWHIIMMVIYIISACLAVIVLYVVKNAFLKCCRKRYVYHVRAAAAIGGMQLQNIQPPAATPTTGNPEAPQHTYEDIPDDTPIDPYAETTGLENPMYGADVTGPRDATSISDPRPRPNGPANSGALSRPQGSSQAPVPPPRPVVPANFSGSYYPPSTETTQAKPKGIPDPLPRTNKHANSNVSLQPQGAKKKKKKTQTHVNSNVSLQPKGLGKATKSQHKSTTDPRSLGMDEDEDDDGPNIYLDLNGSSGLNSNVSSQTRGLKTANTPRHKPTTDPRSLDMDEEEEVDGPNIYLDLNGPPRQSGSEVPQAEDVPDPLPRTNKYVNSNVTSKHRGAEMPQTEKIPDPLPRIHTYVNSNVTSQPRGAELSQEETEKIPDPLPRTHTYVNSNVTSQPRARGVEMSHTEKIPDPLPRIHTYVNTNVTPQPRGTEINQTETEKIPDPLPRTHTYVNSNVTSKPRGEEMPE
ncbi:uncharacterized protein LOC144869434 [Branchiostoma floridae x Branchiostoma japonicum]